MVPEGAFAFDARWGSHTPDQEYLISRGRRTEWREYAYFIRIHIRQF